MKRNELEDAISRLTRLLQARESDEAQYQQFFERHPIVFHVLGYSATVAKPRLQQVSGNYLEPDFIAKGPNGLYEIVELKTPQERLAQSKKNRDKLYAKIEEYISQIETYAEYFDDSVHRQCTNDMLGIDVQKNPDKLLIVGTDDGVDKKLLHLLTRRRSSSLRVVTYGEVLSRLEFSYATFFGPADGLPGESWHGILTLHQVDVGRRQYIFDAGDSLTSNRWSVYMDERNQLCFEIIGRDGNVHRCGTRIGAHGINFDVQVYVCCEFWSSDNQSVMQILVDNRCAVESRFSFPITISTGLDFQRHTIGADISGQNHGTFRMAGMAIYDGPLSFHQRCAITEAIFDEFFGLPGVESLQGPPSRRGPVLPNNNAYLIIRQPES